MKLKLKRPIAFFDLETTGVNVTKDRIIQIYILKIHPDGEEEGLGYLINPEQPISKEVTQLTGISNEDVKDAPTFRDVAQEIYDFIKDCDLAGFNSNRFDIPLLTEEFLRAGINFDPADRNMVDVQVIFHKMEKRDLSAAYKFYVGKELTDAHSAEADTRATYEILKKQLEKYADQLENDIEKLSQFSTYDNVGRKADLAGYIVYNENGEPVINFGKFKGQRVVDVFEKEPGYFDWIMRSDFPLYTKKVFEAIRLSMKFGNTSVGKRKI